MQDFSAKTKALFDCLDGASQDLKGTSLEQRNYNVSELLHKFNANDQRQQRPGNRQVVPLRSTGGDSGNSARLSQLNGKKSIFKKPQLPIGHCLRPKRTPDYVKNPHRWMKYTMMDVSDVTENSNSVAAYEVLKQLEARREANGDDDDDVGADGQAQPERIEFKRSSKIKRQMRQLAEQDEEDPAVDAPKLKGTKYVMPEYVIGQQTNKRNKQPRRPTEQLTAATTSPKSVESSDGKRGKCADTKMKLSHLLEEEEDSD